MHCVQYVTWRKYCRSKVAFAITYDVTEVTKVAEIVCVYGTLDFNTISRDVDAEFDE